MPRPFRLLIVLFAGAAAAACAAERPYLEDLPLVLTASRLPQPLHEVPGAVTVIDRETIAATGYRDLARLFRLVPGMQVGQERGHAQWVSYHGLSNDFPTEMQVLIDGRSVITPSAFGGVDWSALPLTLDEIDRIEVVRGTNANGFGANAFLGVINIITRHSAEGGARGALMRFGDDLLDGQAAWSSVDGPRSLRVAFASQRDDGFDRLDDDRRMDMLTLRGDWQPSPADSVMLRAGASTGERGEGYGDSLFGNNGPRDSSSDSATLHLQWRHSRAADDEWLVSYYRNHERVRDEWFASAPGHPAVPLDRNRRSTRDAVELQRRIRPSPQLQLVGGGEGRRDAIASRFLYFGGDPDPQYLYRLFGNAEWRARPALTLNVGAVAEKYSDAAAHLSPRAFANWQPTRDDTLRAGYARAWRQHNLFEQHGDVRAIDPTSGEVLVRPFLPHPAVRPTRVDTVELGYFGRFATWATTLDVRLFNERLRDFIVRVPQPDPQPAPLLAAFLGSTRYENLDRPITLRGIEYQLVTRPRPGTELRAAHSMIDRRAPSRDIEDRSAPYTASLSWLQDYGYGWSSMLSLLRVGPLAGGDGYVPRFRYRARPYTTFDANVRFRTHFGGRALLLGLAAQNLGAEHQEIADRTEQAVHGQHPVNPASRRVYLSLALELD